MIDKKTTRSYFKNVVIFSFDRPILLWCVHSQHMNLCEQHHEMKEMVQELN